jgi:hypothetical protein
MLKRTRISHRSSCMGRVEVRDCAELRSDEGMPPLSNNGNETTGLLRGSRNVERLEICELEFQLVPTGKLVDGSEGKAISVKRTGRQAKTPHALLDSRDVVNTRYLPDIPIGLYRLSVKRLGAFAGLLNIAFPDSRDNPQKSLDIEFVPIERGNGRVDIWILDV